jgi:ABC-type multidrug transport system fused ATPase/permease subunit
VLARDPKILILDEATSALDNESEQLIQQSLHKLKGKVTMLVIAHRLSTIMDMDTLLVLEGGRIVESGNPRQLLEDKNSHFYRLYHMKM